MMGPIAKLPSWVDRTFLRQKSKTLATLLRFVALLIIVSPAILVSYMSYHDLNQNLTRMVLNRRESIARLSASALKGKFDRMAAVGLTFATRKELRALIQQGRWQEANQILETVPQKISSIESVFITDPNGMEMADRPNLPGEVASAFASWDWWKPYISEVYRRTAEPRVYVIAVAVPVKADDGNVLGILVLQVKLETIRIWSEAKDFEGESFVYFVDRDGRAVIHPKLADGQTIMDFSAVPAVQKVLKGERGVFEIYNPAAREMEISALEPVLGSGWGAVVVESSKSAFKFRDKTLRYHFLILTVVCTLNALLAAFILVSFTFIGKQRQVLEENEARFRALIQTAGDAIVTANDKGEIVDWNKAAEKLFGYRTDQIVNKPLSILMPEHFQTAHKEGPKRFITTGKENLVGRTLEAMGVKANGTEFPVDISLSAWKNEGRDFFTVIIRDTTEKKEAERKIQEAVRIKSEFISLVSHELRTPMAAIKEGVGIVFDETDGPINADQKAHLEIAQRNVDRLARLINEVLDFQKLEAGQTGLRMTSENLNQLVREAVETFGPVVQKKGLKLEANLAPSLPNVACDKDKITQALVNFLNNAVNFTEKGTIWVTTEHGPNWVRVSVLDEGPGIKEDDQAKLFKMFSQVEEYGKRKTGGSGLGLAISKKIIEQHKGRIGCSSRLGAGSTFYFILPITERRKDS